MGLAYNEHKERKKKEKKLSLKKLLKFRSFRKICRTNILWKILILQCTSNVNLHVDIKNICNVVHVWCIITLLIQSKPIKVLIILFHNNVLMSLGEYPITIFCLASILAVLSSLLIKNLDSKLRLLYQTIITSMCF